MSRPNLRITALQTAFLTCFCYSSSPSALAQSVTKAPAAQTTTSSNASSIANQERYSFDIPSLPLVKAIQALAKQSQQNIHLTAGLSSAHPTQVIKGEYSIERALEKMLPNLSLRLTRDAQKDWIISEIELPSIFVTAKKESPDKRISAAQFNLRESLAGIVRYETLISAPTTLSGSGNIWDSNGNSGYNIRGIEGNRIALEVDGIALPDAAPKPDSTSMNSFAVGREYFDPEMMQDVSIATGSSSNANQTAGLGGKVSFRSKAPSDFLNPQRSQYLASKIGFDQQNSGKLASITGAFGNSGVQSLIAIAKRRGEQGKTLSRIPTNPDAWNSIAALAKLDFNLSDWQSLHFSSDYFQAEHQQNLNTRISPLYPLGVAQQAKTEKTGFSIAHQLSSDSSLFDQFNSKLYFQDAKQEDRSRATYVLGGKTFFRTINTAYLNRLLGLRMDAEKKIEQHQLSYGLKWEQSQHERPWQELRLNRLDNTQQITNKNRMADMQNDNFSLYLNNQSRFTFAAMTADITADITTGLRYEQRKSTPKNLHTYLIHIPKGANEIKDETQHAYVPNLAVHFKTSDKLTAHIQLSQNTRFVSAAEKTGTFDSFSYTGAGQGYAILGNPKLNNERNLALEFGIKKQVNSQTNWQWNGFYNRFKDFIEYTLQAPDPINYPNITYGLYRPENLGNAQTWGMELQAQHHFSSWQGSRLQAAIGNANGRIRNEKTGQENFLASVAPLKASINLSYDAPSQVFGYSIAAVANKGKQAANDVLSPSASPRFKVPGYSRFDLSAYWNLQRNLKLSAAVYNITNKKHWDYANSRKLAEPNNSATSNDVERLVMPGRSASLNLQYHF
jgi:hemoglobin/transferrin/lactoferrin receptor protein